MTSPLSFLRQACRPKRQAIATWIIAAALVAAAASLIPALAGLLLATKGATWAIATGFVAACIFAMRGAIRQQLSHLGRTVMLTHIGRTLATRSPLSTASHGAGRLEATLFGSSYAASRLVSEQAPTLIGNALAFVVVAPFVVWLTTWELAIIALPAITVFALALFFLRRYLTRKMKGAHDAALAMVDESSSLLRGHLELAASARLDQQARRMAERANDYSHAVRRSERASAIGGRIPMLAAGSLALFLGWLWLGDRPELLESSLVKVLVIGSVLPIVGGIAKSISEAHRNLREIAPVVELLDVPEAPHSKPNAVKLDPNQAIRFHNVSFAYNSDPGGTAKQVHTPGGKAKQLHTPGGTAKQAAKRTEAVLDRGNDALALPPTSLTWRPNEFLALTGPNGTGKSTLVRLLLRLADPKEGAIYIGSTDLREGDTEAWRKSIAYLPQRPYLPEGFTLRAVLRTFGPDLSEERLLEALETVGLLPKLHRYHPSDPLDAKVAMLSAGERQRFALARVLSDPARVLILDEPDANLDAAGLEALISSLPGLAKERRILLVAHDRRLLACANRTFELGSTRGSPRTSAALH